MERFLTDVMLGTLTRYLRMMGHDTAYADEIDDGERDAVVVATARSEDRTVVTRDRALADDAEDAGGADGAVLLRSRDVAEQLRELHDATGIALELDAPGRCSACNGALEQTDDRPEHAPDDVDRVWRCRDCGKHYWRGSHWDDVADRLASIRDG